MVQQRGPLRAGRRLCQRVPRHLQRDRGRHRRARQGHRHQQGPGPIHRRRTRQGLRRLGRGVVHRHRPVRRAGPRPHRHRPARRRLHRQDQEDRRARRERPPGPRRAFGHLRAVHQAPRPDHSGPDHPDRPHHLEPAGPGPPRSGKPSSPRARAGCRFADPSHSRPPISGCRCRYCRRSSRWCRRGQGHSSRRPARPAGLRGQRRQR